MRRLTPGILASILLHGGLLTLAILFWPKEELLTIQFGSVPVSVVSDVIQQAAPAEELSDEPAAEETVADTDIPSDTPAPEPTPQPTPTPPPPPRDPPPTKKRETTQPPREQPQRRPDPPRETQSRTETARRETRELDIESLAGGGQRQTQRDSGSGEAREATGRQAAMLQGQVDEHWNLIFCDMAGGDSLTINLTMTIDGRGRITDGPNLVQPGSGPVFRAASESVLRAIRSAAPFTVPDGYRTSVVRFRFDTARACANR